MTTTPTLPLPGQVVMTIIVAFILEAFVFRMNYNRKSQDSEGLYGCPALSTGCPLATPGPAVSTAAA